MKGGASSFSERGDLGSEREWELDAAGLRDKLKAFAAAPYDPDPWAKAFGGGQGRIRHGDWRAVYQIDGDALLVTVLKVGNRKEVYR